MLLDMTYPLNKNAHFQQNGTFYNGSRSWSETPEHQYVAVLRVDKLKKSDQGDEHILRVTNPRGTTEYTVKIQHIKSETIMTIFPSH